MSVPEDQLGLDNLRDLAVEQLSSEELRHYERHTQQLLTAIAPRLPEVQRGLSAQARELQVARFQFNEDDAKKKRVERRINAGCYLIMASLALLSVVFLLEVFVLGTTPIKAPAIGSLSDGVNQLIFGLLTAGACGCLFILRPLFVRNTPSARRVEDSERRLFSTQSKYLDAQKIALAGALRSIINVTLGKDDALIFPTDSPALIELDSAQIIESDTIAEVQSFVKQHTASAIGLAGPRGVGKSTILRAVLSHHEGRELGVYVHSPVKYDATQFVRRLFEEVVSSAREDGKVGFGRLERRSTFRRRARRHTVLRLVLAALSALLGAGMLLVASFGAPTWSAVQVVGATLLGLASVLMILELVKLLEGASDRRDLRLSEDPKESILEDASNLLRWRPELTKSSKTAIKPVGGLMEISEDDATKESAIDRTHAELVSELRRFLRDYRRAADLDRVIIAIDELDKLSKPSDLVDAVNGLKELFHIEGTHFIVAVSTDALDSFALRGVPARDAFDSSFDTIVPVRRLNTSQSLAVLGSRAAGFPVPLALFCHAWSGGLPRDLLRTARTCVEEYARGSHTQEAIVRAIVIGSTERGIAAYARSRSLGVSESVGHGAFAEAIRHIRKGRIGDAAALLEPLGDEVHVGEIATLQRYLISASAILAEYTKTVPLSDSTLR